MIFTPPQVGPELFSALFYLLIGAWLCAHELVLGAIDWALGGWE